MKIYKTIFLLFLLLFFFAGCESKEKKDENIQKKEIKVTEGVIKEQQVVNKEVDKGQFYYSYQEEDKKNIDAKEEESYTKIDAYRRVRSPYERVQISLLANKLSKDFIVHCSAL